MIRGARLVILDFPGHACKCYQQSRLIAGSKPLCIWMPVPNYSCSHLEGPLGVLCAKQNTKKPTAPEKGKKACIC